MTAEPAVRVQPFGVCTHALLVPLVRMPPDGGMLTVVVLPSVFLNVSVSDWNAPLLPGSTNTQPSWVADAPPGMLSQLWLPKPAAVVGTWVLWTGMVVVLSVAWARPG